MASVTSSGNHDLVTYWYEGRCPYSGGLVRLPRTAQAEAIAHSLMQHLSQDKRYSREGKMYGVLLVTTPSGEQQVFKAFSGLLNGDSTVADWVPPIPGREQVALEEAQTLEALDTIKQALIALQQMPERQHYETLHHEFEGRLQQLAACHRQRKQERQHQRQTLLATLSGDALAAALTRLDDASRQDGIERRQLKRQRDAALQPLKQTIDTADTLKRELKHQRKTLSRQLQAQMHATYRLTNFLGESLPLQQLMPGGVMPTGTGDCCAPKLLHYAATQGCVPIAMAEFWWGPPSTDGDKMQGHFYGACAERCQPLMGFLLAGFSQAVPLDANFSERHLDSVLTRSLPILYEDQWLIAVNKPSGLLSVPGRRSDRQDCVLNRLRYQLPDGATLVPVHRLDQDTSGILLLARDPQTHQQISQQFQRRQIHKVYEALVAGSVTADQGVIDLPLWGDPSDRPYQTVDWQRGKPSLTKFAVLARRESATRVEFVPVTGRTHQIRVHAADPRGLGAPILGDRLYGGAEATRLHSRLYLHAKQLCFVHPQSGNTLCVQAETPF